ncbi:putative branched-chain-amino-acid aminotransferase [Candidatus Jidaibacter acanthamoeba]|uniref:Branched-chain-amino-acid aminotransferase n=1 Tax=Candidatus Jidaibacter acanthamoebae TaxID=86105 RepID=A0A0C1QJV9_9RICK|nr:branched-chain amino acid transaminase [Candidatus Jidaibacter acanthamoeba]KIE04438.1 putative branched-chain-amino-acid aminotransferase [Candidatus Jidaibacter acanthamoeba]
MSLIPFDQREGFIWFDGDFVEWKDAKIHILTHGLHYGCTVFEGIRVYNYKPFKLREHQQRLINSAKLVGYNLPFTLEELELAAINVVKKQNIKDGYLRPVAWLGSETMLISGNNCKVHTAIAGWETFEQSRTTIRERGARVVISNWIKPPADCTPFKSKASGIYMIATMVKNEATAKGFDDALMLDINQNITEATTSNFFIITGNKLLTPIPDCFLNGITRQTVIEIAKTNGMEVIEKYIKIEDLNEAEAAFFTGTAIEIMPIGQIAATKATYGFDIKNHKLKLLMEAYSKLVNA